jgi:hypothetical protein
VEVFPFPLFSLQQITDYAEAFTLIPASSPCGSLFCPLVDVHFSDQTTGVSSRQHFQIYAPATVIAFISWRDGHPGGLLIPTCNTTLTLCKVNVASFACTGGGGAQATGQWIYGFVGHPFTLTVQDHDSLAGYVENEGIDTVTFQTTTMLGAPYSYTETGYSIVDVLCP